MRAQNLQFLALAGLVLVVAVLAPLIGRQDTVSTPSEDAVSTLATGALDAAYFGDVVRYREVGTSNLVAVDATTGQERSRILTTEPAQQVLWDPKEESALVRTIRPTTRWQLVRFSNLSSTELHENAFSPAWSPKGDRIAYVYIDRKQNTYQLTVANPDGSNWSTVLTLPISRGFSELWWSPLETYLVGLDLDQEPPRYVRVFLSSKRIETLAEGGGSLRWSPSGKLALLDGVTPGYIQIANIETGEVVRHDVTATVDTLTWLDETALAGVVLQETGSSAIARIDLPTKKITLDTEVVLPADIQTVVGSHNGALLIQADNTVIRTTSKLLGS